MTSFARRGQPSVEKGPLRDLKCLQNTLDSAEMPFLDRANLTAAEKQEKA